MNRDELVDDFKQIGVEVIVSEGDIREKTDDSENYYGIQFDNNQWFIYENERGRKNERYSYSDEEDAFSSFYIFGFRKKIMKDYVLPIINNNEVLYDEGLSYEDIKDIFEKNSIGQLKDFSISIEKNQSSILLAVFNEEGNDIHHIEMTAECDALFVLLQWQILLFKFQELSEYLIDEYTAKKIITMC